MINLHQVTVEGCDLSGKTTHIRKIHEATHFKWNIHDRGELSMLCYSRLYGRSDVSYWRERLTASLNNMNNALIILMPSWSVICKRYHARGDDIQNIRSLKLLDDIFREEVSLIKNYATVCVISRDNELDHAHETSVGWLCTIEDSCVDDVIDAMAMNVTCVKHQECSPILCVMSYDKDAVQELNSIARFSCEDEEVYYHEITAKCLKNIENELRGLNEYNIVQSITSRRFIYTDPSCISMIHTLYRDNSLNVYVVCRSTNVETKLESDLKFLLYLTTRIQKHLALPDDININLHLTLNSAHIIA